MDKIGNVLRWLIPIDLNGKNLAVFMLHIELGTRANDRLMILVDPQMLKGLTLMMILYKKKKCFL